ncbi:unnamed protein product [Echinostoma caproni]|uniref:GCM domain-containing protein n=1 Tax=Echinostoma caproni TaxID=27848 RepID=A0A183B3D1_9TREM|nr:unnamed protein product [Echinostoma caproni]
MDAYHMNWTSSLSDEAQCRQPIKSSVRVEEEDELFRRCRYCGRFSAVNNTSNVENVNDTCVSDVADKSEACIGHPIDRGEPGDAQNPEWEHSISLQAPQSSIHQRTSAELADTETPQTHSVRFSNFGDQVNIQPRYPLRKPLMNGRLYTCRTPVRVSVANLRNSLPDNKPILTQLHNHSKNARMKQLNELSVPGYSSLYFPNRSNVSHDLQNAPIDVPSASGTNRDEREPVSDLVGDESWNAPEKQTYSEHHCSSNCGDTMWQLPVDPTDVMNYSHVTGPNGSFSCRIPRRFSHVKFCPAQYSPCMTEHLPQ